MQALRIEAEADAKGLRAPGHPALKTMAELKKTASGNPKALVQVSIRVLLYGCCYIVDIYHYGYILILKREAFLWVVGV